MTPAAPGEQENVGEIAGNAKIIVIIILTTTTTTTVFMHIFVNQPLAQGDDSSLLPVGLFNCYGYAGLTSHGAALSEIG